MRESSPVVPGESGTASERGEQVVTPRQGRQRRDEQGQRDIHGDHTLSVDQLSSFRKLEDLARDDADKTADDDAEDDLVEEDEEDPVPDGFSDRVSSAEQEHECEVLFWNWRTWVSTGFERAATKWGGAGLTRKGNAAPSLQPLSAWRMCRI
jgi:hypothetical protein